MAFDILSIPSMSPELERAFSQAKKLITFWRKESAWWRDSDGMRMSEAVAGYR
jgi:hAT family protein